MYDFDKMQMLENQRLIKIVLVTNNLINGVCH